MEITKENYDNLKSQKLKRVEIAKAFNIPEWKLKKIITANKWGIVRIPYEYNGCFDTINSNSAYWLGFFMADGSVDDDNRVRIYLQASDINQLRKFKEFVGCTNIIQTSTTYNRVALEFTSVDIINIFNLYNIIPRKTLIAVPPNPEIFGSYFKDYLRGFFDGDGTICESFSNKNSVTATLYTGFAIAEQSFDWIDNVLTNIVGISYKRFKKPNMYSITLNTNKSKILLKYMYENSNTDNRLDRKYDLYYKTVVMDNRSTR
jgi:DNA-binding transcriptional regulator WhiA